MRGKSISFEHSYQKTVLKLKSIELWQRKAGLKISMLVSAG